MNNHIPISAALALGALLALSSSALAGGLPDAVTASPDVYKVIAENDSLRIVAATWQPGQRYEKHLGPLIEKVGEDVIETDEKRIGVDQ